MSLFDEKYSRYKREFEDCLTRFVYSLEGKTLSENLVRSVSYSLLAEGKRIRPVLFFATLDALNVDYTKYSDFAVAIELIHNYSLVHDDLPAMDNDDFRRGKPTNHKLFGEAMALLAGDAMLNSAYELLLGMCVKDASLAKPSKILSEAVGYTGMIGGQAVDIELENYPKDVRTATYIDENKTSKLITAPVECASVIANSAETVEYCSFADNLGHLFQLTDDLIDGDGMVSVIGRDETIKLVQERYNNCKNALSRIKNNEFFCELTEKIKNRYEKNA